MKHRSRVRRRNLLALAALAAGSLALHLRRGGRGGRHDRGQGQPYASDDLLASAVRPGNGGGGDGKDDGDDAAHAADEPSSPYAYRSSPSERYVLDHAADLGLDASVPSAMRPTCDLWTGTAESASASASAGSGSGSESESGIASALAAYREELRRYRSAVLNFAGVDDLRAELRAGVRTREEVCRTVDLDLDGIFESGQLSSSLGGDGGGDGGRDRDNGKGKGRGDRKVGGAGTGTGFGRIEPLLPPLRHPEFCFDSGRRRRNFEFWKGGPPEHLLDLGYLVHDFRALCEGLSPHSRTVLVDMGASLAFHGDGDGDGERSTRHAMQPALYLTELYRRFGFPFDHVYAFEVTPTDPSVVFNSVPEYLLPSYHWINVGVSPDPNSRLNPLRMVLQAYDEDDVVIIKLDVDNPAIEVKLVAQLLSEPRYASLVDHFYFEHHVLLDEMTKNGWGTGDGVRGSVRQSLELFRELRRRGIASHYWP